MLKTIEELESVESGKMKALCKMLNHNDIAITLHGVSPQLVEKFQRSMSLLQKIKIRFSPYRKVSIKLEIVEKTHNDIVELYNSRIDSMKLS